MDRPFASTTIEILLDRILDELMALRKDFHATQRPPEPDDETVQLREPTRRGKVSK